MVCFRSYQRLETIGKERQKQERLGKMQNRRSSLRHRLVPHILLFPIHLLCFLIHNN